MGDSLKQAYEKAFNADAVSAFGGIVALNRPIDEATASELTKTFLECVVAPGCEGDAQAILAAKSKVRVLILPDLSSGPKETVKAIAGGFLVQAADDAIPNTSQWQVVTERQPTESELAELLFAWKVCKHVISRIAICLESLQTRKIKCNCCQPRSRYSRSRCRANEPCWLS